MATRRSKIPYSTEVRSVVLRTLRTNVLSAARRGDDGHRHGSLVREVESRAVLSRSTPDVRAGMDRSSRPTSCDSNEVAIASSFAPHAESVAEAIRGEAVGEGHRLRHDCRPNDVARTTGRSA